MHVENELSKIFRRKVDLGIFSSLSPYIIEDVKRKYGLFMRKDKAYLQHILEAISDIEEFIENISKEEFHRDKEKQYAVLRALEIIEEATKNLSKDLRAKYPEIPWKDIAGMRDKLIHEYFGVKLELVWETVKDKLPKLKKQISKILDEIT